MSRAFGMWILLLAVAMAGLVAPQARAATTTEVVIEALFPQLIDLSQPDQRITITGKFRNAGDVELGNVSVHFWRSPTPISDHDELEQVLVSEATQPLGRRLPDNNQDEANAVYVGDAAPGAEVSFTVSATVGDLTLAENDVAYLLGVHVRGNTPGGLRETVGRSRVLAVAASSPMPVTTVVKLSTTPSLLDGSDFQDDSLAQKLTGELAETLTAAEVPGVQVLLDPALLVELRVLSQQHTVAQATRSGNPEARKFVTRIEALISAGRVQRLPFGNPDLARIHASGGLSAVEEALAWSQTALEAEDLAILADTELAADLASQASQDLALTLAMNGVTTIYGDNIASSGKLESTTGQVGTALRVAPTSQPGVGPGDTETEVQIVGRRLAETLLGDSPAVRMVRSAADIEQAQPISGLETSSQLPSPHAQARFEDPTEAVEAWPQLEASIDELFHDDQLIQELTGTDRSATNAAVAARANSADFATEAAALGYVNATPAEQLDAEQVRLSVPNQVVMGSDTNYFPATVHNQLSVPVTVKVVFTSDANKRLTVLPSDAVTIAPGEHRTINLTTETTSNGIVLVHGQLATEQGTRFGPEISVEITATGLGRIGWIIIIVSGAVVLGGTFLRIRAVQRERAKVNREQ